MGKILHAILVHGPRVNYDLDTMSQFQGEGHNALAEIYVQAKISLVTSIGYDMP